MGTLIYGVVTKTILLNMNGESNDVQVSLKMQRLSTEKLP